MERRRHTDEVELADFPAVLREAEPAEKAATPPSVWHDLIITPVSEGGRNDLLARFAGHLVRVADPSFAVAFCQSGTGELPAATARGRGSSIVASIIKCETARRKRADK